MIVKKKDIWLTKLLKKNCYKLSKLTPINKLKAKSFYTYKSIKKIKYNRDYNLVAIGIKLFLKKKILKDKKKLKNIIQLKSIRNFKESLFDLVKNNFLYSRFGSDRLISKKIVNKIFYQWVIDSIKTKKKEVYCIVNSNNKVVSCIIIKKERKKIIIDLTVSNKRYQGKGFAKGIINHILKKYPKKDIIVGTELNNLSALRFYKKIGFKQIEKNFIYHVHR